MTTAWELTEPSATPALLDLASYLALEESAARGGMPLALPLSHPTAYERTLEAELRQRYGAEPEDLEAFALVR